MASVAGGMTLGMMTGHTHDSMHSFMDDFKEVSPEHYAYAVLAGFFICAGSFLFLKGVDMLGLALAFPLGVGTVVVAGTTLTYVIELRNHRVCDNPFLLFLGIFSALCAVVVSAIVQHLKAVPATP